MKPVVRRMLLLFCALATFSGTADAQKVALKTNLLYDASGTINLGVEAALSKHLTVDISGNYIPWKINGHSWRHWMAQPELRIWTCERFGGSFFGVHAIGGQFNFEDIKNNVSFLATDLRPLGDHRVQGWGIGAGISYGYAFILSRHLNLELEIGVGYIYSRYDMFDHFDFERRVAENAKHEYVGPTKASLNFVYVF